MPETLKAFTGGGGRHLYYFYPPDLMIKGDNRGKWLQGVDIKSDGGYVMLPESEHLSGSRYSWINWGQTPVWLPPDVANDLVQVSTVSTARGDLPDTSTILQGVPEGQRDDVLFRLACRLRRQLGDGARRAVEILILEAASNCDPPFPPAEALRKVESAWQQDHSDTFVDWMEAFVQSRVIGDESRRCVAGGDFILDEPGVIPAIWGQGERVLWPEGEGIMITGHQASGRPLSRSS